MKPLLASLLLPVLAAHHPSQSLPMALVETFPGFPKPPALWTFPVKVVFPSPIAEPSQVPASPSVLGSQTDIHFTGQVEINITTTGPGGAAVLAPWYSSNWILVSAGGFAYIDIDTNSCLPGQVVTIETSGRRLQSARSSFVVY